MRPKIIPAVALATVSFIFVTGCSSIKSPPVSSACTEALSEQATAIVDMSLTDEQANAAELSALSACKDSAEWIKGVKTNPSSIGFGEPMQDEIESNLFLTCRLLDNLYLTPVCTDAHQRGLLD